MEISDEMIALEADDGIRQAAFLASTIGTFISAINQSAAMADLVNWASSYCCEKKLGERLVEILKEDVDMRYANPRDPVIGAYLYAIKAFSKEDGKRAAEEVQKYGKNLQWSQQIADRLVHGHGRFETPQVYYAHIVGSGGGCDYSVGCNERLVKLGAQYHEAAYDELKELFKGHGGAGSVKSITLINVSHEHAFSAKHLEEN